MTPPPGRPAPAAPFATGGAGVGDATRRRLRRVFLDGFVALDVAEPLVSFDADRPAGEVRRFMEARDFDRVGVRRDGLVRGYAARAELGRGTLGDHLHPFGPDDLVRDDASLQAVIQSLGLNERCFVTVLGEVAAIVTLQDLEKPPVRMFLFGMLSVLELLLVRTIEAAFPGEVWRAELSEGRLEKARHLQAERARRGVQARLVDCLQFSDKGQLALAVPAVQRSAIGQLSGKAQKRAIKELELLRNHLAHGQEIVPAAWRRIVAFSANLDALLESL